MARTISGNSISNFDVGISVPKDFDGEIAGGEISRTRIGVEVRDEEPSKFLTRDEVKAIFVALKPLNARSFSDAEEFLAKHESVQPVLRAGLDLSKFVRWFYDNWYEWADIFRDD